MAALEPSSDIPDFILKLAQQTLNDRPAQNETALQDPRQGGPLLQDDSAADPASLGVTVLLASLKEPERNGEIKGVNFSTAAQKELEFQLYNVPRTSDGAISHRRYETAMWSDFTYMTPPFLAFYGLFQNNQTLLQEAYDQCRLYRSGLQDPNTKLWKHIVGGQSAQDDGLWATGNAWASAGMLRVAATIKRSQYASEMESQYNDLGTWAGEIIGAAKTRTSQAGLVRNYIDQPSTFADTASSSLLAYSALRLSTMGFTSDHENFGLQIHSSVVGSHIDDEGKITSAVDPLTWKEVIPSGSPEAQSFVMLMEASYQDFLSKGGKDDTKAGKEDEDAASSIKANLKSVLPVAVAAAGVVSLLM